MIGGFRTLAGRPVRYGRLVVVLEVDIFPGRVRPASSMQNGRAVCDMGHIEFALKQEPACHLIDKRRG